jgi:hypothetical protein
VALIVLIGVISPTASTSLYLIDVRISNSQ